jgi:hypothetical protein
MSLVADRYSWEVDEWREKAHDAYAKLDRCEKEREFHTRKLEQTVAWLTVQLREKDEMIAALKAAGAERTDP